MNLRIKPKIAFNKLTDLTYYFHIWCLYKRETRF